MRMGFVMFIWMRVRRWGRLLELLWILRYDF